MWVLVLGGPTGTLPAVDSRAQMATQPTPSGRHRPTSPNRTHPEYQVASIRGQLSPLMSQNCANPLVQSSHRATSPANQPVSPPLLSINNRTTSSPALQAKSKVPPPPTPTPVARLPQDPHQVDLVKALWGYDASGGADELRFSVGDTIEVIERLDNNWWKGRHTHNGKTGLLPSAYVEAVPVNERPQTLTYPPEKQTTTTALFASPSSTSGDLKSRWKPVQSRWSSGGPSTMPAAPSSTPPLPPLPGRPRGLQPYVPTQEEVEKRQKLKYMGGRLGTSAATGAAFGVGAGIARGLVG